MARGGHRKSHRRTARHYGAIDTRLTEIRDRADTHHAASRTEAADVTTTLGDIKTAADTHHAASRTEAADLKTGIGDVRRAVDRSAAAAGVHASRISRGLGHMNGTMRGVRRDVGDMRTDIGGMRTDIGDMRTGIGDMRTDMAAMRTALASGMGPGGTPLTAAQIADLKKEIEEIHKQADRFRTLDDKSSHAGIQRGFDQSLHRKRMATLKAGSDAHKRNAQQGQSDVAQAKQQNSLGGFVRAAEEALVIAPCRLLSRGITYGINKTREQSALNRVVEAFASGGHTRTDYNSLTNRNVSAWKWRHMLKNG